MNKKAIAIIVMSALCGVANAGQFDLCEVNNTSMYGLHALLGQNSKDLADLKITTPSSQQNKEEKRLLNERQEIVQRFTDKKILNKEIDGNYQAAQQLWASGGITREEFNQRIKEVSLTKDELLALEDDPNQSLKTLNQLEAYNDKIISKAVRVEKENYAGQLTKTEYQKTWDNIHIMEKTYQYSLNNYFYDLE